MQNRFKDSIWDIPLTNGMLSPRQHWLTDFKRNFGVKWLDYQKDEKLFDRFKGRVMFPIHSMSGRVMGFGGRILKQDNQTAKYVNSSESEVYQKSKVLYGLYQAKQHIAKQSKCYLVEGYTDVIVLHQAGIQNVVSSSGTAMTPDQVRLIRRLTDNITLLFDGDAAGLRAAMRGVDIILEAGMQVSICTFPDGEDPDSFVRNHQPNEVKQFLENNTIDFIVQFKAKLLIKEGKNEPIQKAKLYARYCTEYFRNSRCHSTEVYIQSCSSLMNISEDVLFSTLAQLLQKKGQLAKQAPKLSEMQVVNVPNQKVDPRSSSNEISYLYYCCMGRKKFPLKTLLCGQMQKVKLFLHQLKLVLKFEKFISIYNRTKSSYQLKAFENFIILYCLFTMLKNLLLWRRFTRAFTRAVRIG